MDTPIGTIMPCDVLGVMHSLHRRWWDAPTFYGAFAATIALGAGIALLPAAPLGPIQVKLSALLEGLADEGAKGEGEQT